MKIIFATGNKGKLREAAEILGDGFTLMSPADMGITEDVEETGETLIENSVIKADYIHTRTGLDCFADDTGLEVDALGGAPGVHSARYATEGHDFEDNIDKLLTELAKHPGEPRTARFRTSVTLIVGGVHHFFDGVMEGHIATEKHGKGGFGYDPIFVPEGYTQTNAELGDKVKNAISHRSKALRAMAEFLKK
jgi:XTP/dITP diphosphohydrolase